MAILDTNIITSGKSLDQVMWCSTSWPFWIQKSLPLGNLQIKSCDALHHGHFGYKNHYLWEISRLSYVMLYIMAILHYLWVSTKSPSWARFRTQNHHFSISKFSLSQNWGTNKDLKLHLSELKTVLCCLFDSWIHTQQTLVCHWMDGFDWLII
jgi:hypothetical protein